MATAMTTYPVKSPMNGQTENRAACPNPLTTHIRWAPNRSTARPMGSATRKPATPAMVSPRPTSGAVSPTIWVKKTAEPVMKVPSPRAKSRDCSDKRPANRVGGRR